MGVVSMYICSMLHVFEILPGVDEEGDEIILTDEFNDGAAMLVVFMITTFSSLMTPIFQGTCYFPSALQAPIWCSGEPCP